MAISANRHISRTMSCVSFRAVRHSLLLAITISSSAFTSYTKDSFNDENQKELAEFYKEISKKDARLMLSNSNPKNTNKEDDFFDELYKEFNINTIMANRNINSKADGRKAISELLITNYKVD